MFTNFLFSALRSNFIRQQESMILWFFQMKIRISLLLSVLALSIDSKYVKKKPQLRALWNLEEVTECELHYNALVCLEFYFHKFWAENQLFQHYNNYGCWCGIGGSHTPVDGIDECCMHHDKCYDKAVDDKVIKILSIIHLSIVSDLLKRWSGIHRRLHVALLEFNCSLLRCLEKNFFYIWI